MQPWRAGRCLLDFLTTYPSLSINHSVLIYKQKPFSPNPGVERYFVYDPNHPESPRELIWSPQHSQFFVPKRLGFHWGLRSRLSSLRQVAAVVCHSKRELKNLNIYVCGTENIITIGSKRCLDFARRDTKTNQCQTNHHHPNRIHQHPPRLLNHCRRIRRRFRRRGEILFFWRKQKPQRRFNPRCPSRFAVIGALGLPCITKIDFELPAFFDQVIA